MCYALRASIDASFQRLDVYLGKFGRAQGTCRSRRLTYVESRSPSSRRLLGKTCPPVNGSVESKM